MKLVDDYKKWKKWWSMRFIILSTIFTSAALVWPTLPMEWTAEFHPITKYFFGIGALTTGIAAGVSRVVKQTKLEE